MATLRASKSIVLCLLPAALLVLPEFRCPGPQLGFEPQAASEACFGCAEASCSAEW